MKNWWSFTKGAVKFTWKSVGNHALVAWHTEVLIALISSKKIVLAFWLSCVHFIICVFNSQFCYLVEHSQQSEFRKCQCVDVPLSIKQCYSVFVFLSSVRDTEKKMIFYKRQNNLRGWLSFQNMTDVFFPVSDLLPAVYVPKCLTTYPTWVDYRRQKFVSNITACSIMKIHCRLLFAIIACL